MNWNYPFDTTEYFFIFFFILVYTGYIFRAIGVVRQLKTTARSIIIKLFLRTITFALLIISLLGPSFGEEDREITAKGKDIFLLVDLSKSMDAGDVTPSRLEKAKFEMNRFIKNERANRIGIIVFSNDAFVQVPLTYDAAALEVFITSLQTNLLPKSGTNICSAIELAYNKLTKGSDKTDRSKMMVLFTDGETSNDCSGNVFNNLRRFGIGFYVLAIGTKSGISVPMNGKPMLDDNKQLVISKMNGAYLQKLAANTNGQYYELNNTRNDVGQMITDVSAANGALVDAHSVRVVSNKYYYFLGVAFLLIIIDVLITIGTFRL